MFPEFAILARMYINTAPGYEAAVEILASKIVFCHQTAMFQDKLDRWLSGNNWMTPHEQYGGTFFTWLPWASIVSASGVFFFPSMKLQNDYVD